MKRASCFFILLLFIYLFFFFDVTNNLLDNFCSEIPTELIISFQRWNFQSLLTHVAIECTK